MKLSWWIRTACLAMAAAAPLGAAGKWLALRSENFEMYAQTGEGSARDTLEYLEKVRGFFQRAFNNLTPSLPVRIIAFSSEKEYNQYRPNEVAMAFYQPGQGRDTIVLGKISEDVRPVAVHEFVHLLVQRGGMKIPVWMNEGLAELYSTMRPIGKQVQVGGLVVGRFQLLQQAKWLPLETITGVTHDSPQYNERDRAGMFYAESWALVHMLALDQDYSAGFTKLVAAIQAGQPADEAFQAVYSKPLGKVRSDLENYVLRSDRFRVALFDIKLDKSAETAVVGQADSYDVGLALAGLLERKQPEEARKRYEALTHEQAQRPEAFEALGFLESRTQRDAAAEHFKRAVELDSKNPKVYWAYALSLQTDQSAEGEMIRTLEKMLTLEPDNLEAKLLLGNRLVRAGRYQEALGRLSDVKRVTPEMAPRLFYTLAFATVQAGELKEAEALAKRAQDYASTIEEKNAAAQLLRYIDQRQRLPEQARQAAPPPPPTPAAPAGDEKDQPRRMVRRTEDAGRSVVQRETSQESGTLVELDCREQQPRLVAMVGGSRRSYLIDNPQQVVVRSANGGTVDFMCGPLKEQKVTVEFAPNEDAEHGTVGSLRGLELQ